MSEKASAYRNFTVSEKILTVARTRLLEPAWEGDEDFSIHLEMSGTSLTAAKTSGRSGSGLDHLSLFLGSSVGLARTYPAAEQLYSQEHEDNCHPIYEQILVPRGKPNHHQLITGSSRIGLTKAVEVMAFSGD